MKLNSRYIEEFSYLSNRHFGLILKRLCYFSGYLKCSQVLRAPTTLSAIKCAHLISLRSIPWTLVYIKPSSGSINYFICNSLFHTFILGTFSTSAVAVALTQTHLHDLAIFLILCVTSHRFSMGNEEKEIENREAKRVPFSNIWKWQQNKSHMHINNGIVVDGLSKTLRTAGSERVRENMNEMP